MSGIWIHNCKCICRSQPNSPVKTSTRWKDEDILSSHQTYETFIELMCQFESRRVSAYLKSKTSHYHNQKVLKICQRYNLVEAQAFVLEEEGLVDEAFNLMKKDLDIKIKSVLVEDLSQGIFSDQEENVVKYTQPLM